MTSKSSAPPNGMLARVDASGRLTETAQGWGGEMPGFKALKPDDVREAIEFMIFRGILYDDLGVWSIGREGEAAFGRRHFMDLLSAFTTATD